VGGRGRSNDDIQIRLTTHQLVCADAPDVEPGVGPVRWREHGGGGRQDDRVDRVIKLDQRNLMIEKPFQSLIKKSHFYYLFCIGNFSNFYYLFCIISIIFLSGLHIFINFFCFA
jgi:hypothetical protein